MSNIDRMFIVSSTVLPSPSTLLIDRQISICEKKGIEPVVVFNKTDIESAQEYAMIYEKAGFITVCTSCETRQGIETLREHLTSGIQ